MLMEGQRLEQIASATEASATLLLQVLARQKYRVRVTVAIGF